MEDTQSRSSNTSRESGSEFANSVTGSTKESLSGKGSMTGSTGKLSIAHSTAGSETAEAPMEVATDDIKNFCATQACAQPTDIVKLAEATLQNLKVLWDEIGFAEHECENATAEMFAEVKRVFENKLSTTQEVKCQLTSQIRLANARICTIGTELGEGSAVSAFKSSEETSPNLRAVLAASKAFLDDLEARKAERTGVLTKKAEELSGLFLEVEGALSAEQTKFLKVVSDFTVGRIEQFDARIKEMEAVKAERQEGVRGRVEEVKALWEELAMEPEASQAGSVDARIHGGEEWRLTEAGLAELAERVAQLAAEKEGRVAARDKAMGELEGLWAITKAPPEETAAFTAAHATLSNACQSEMKAEIQRLQGVKAAMMKELVARGCGLTREEQVLEKREQLREAWEAMRLSGPKRQAFTPAHVEEFTEEALAAHDEELQRCQTELAAMQPLLKIIDRRVFIRAEEAAMKESQGDPSRLLGRGRGMAERLKQEEKIRNMVQKELPKLNEKLKAGIAEFKAAHGRDFEVDGVVFEEVLREEMEAISAAKGRKGAGGKAGPPPASTSKGAPPQTPRDGKEGGDGAAGKAEKTPGSALNTKFRTAAKALSRVPMASLDTNAATGKRPAEGEPDSGATSARNKSPKHGVAQTAPARGPGQLKRTIMPKH